MKRFPRTFALFAALMAVPAVAWAAQTAYSALCPCGGGCPFG